MPEPSALQAKPSPLARWAPLVWLLVFAPAMFCAYQVAKHAVDVPVWDDWERVQLLEKHYAGELDLEYLASAHIDHRPLVPRVLALLLNGTTGGDLRAEMWVGFGAMAIAALLLAAVVARALPAGPWRWGSVFCINLFLFSPVQYQNFLWATQMAYLLPLMCLCFAVWAMGSRRLTVAGKLVSGVVAATVATYCFGHGLIVWPVVVCMALLARDGQGIGRRVALVGSLLVAGAVVVWMYFGWNYVNTSHPAHAFNVEPGERPPGVQNLDVTLGTAEGRKKAKRYFLTSLGNPYARVFQSQPAKAAPKLGGWALVLFGVLAVWAFWRKRKMADFNAMLPWLAVGGFAISNAVLQSLGRAAISLDRAILPRYISSTQFLGIALIGGGAVLLFRWANSTGAAVTQSKRGAVAGGVVVAIAALHVPCWDYGVHKMDAWRAARLQEQFELSYLRLKDPDTVTRVDKETAMPQVKRGVELMAQHGLLDFELMEEWRWGDVVPLDRLLPKTRADVWRANLVRDDLMAIEGWAEFGGDGNRAADGMVLTYRPAKRKGGEKVFGVVETHPLLAPRAWIEDGHFGAPTPSYSKPKNAVGWSGLVDIGDLPEGALLIKVWAVDMAKREALGLKTTFVLDRSSAQTGTVLVNRGKLLR
jgi:hypothetical protein